MVATCGPWVPGERAIPPVPSAVGDSSQSYSEHLCSVGTWHFLSPLDKRAE